MRVRRTDTVVAGLAVALFLVGAGPASRPAVLTPEGIARIIPPEFLPDPGQPWTDDQFEGAQKAFEDALNDKDLVIKAPVGDATTTAAKNWRVTYRGPKLAAAKGQLGLRIDFDMRQSEARRLRKGAAPQTFRGTCLHAQLKRGKGKPGEDAPDLYVILSDCTVRAAAAH